MKKSIFVFALLLVSSAVSLLFAQISVENEMYKLDNGLTVILHHDSSAPIVTVNLWYHTGSKDEKPGRTGFAHLFEHMLFQGSLNVGDDKHFILIQGVGGSLNGSTNSDRTNYYETTPSNYLEMLLWLESDRMGWLLPAMTDKKLENQKDVVKNERRQSFENRPYGLAWLNIYFKLYPDDHPYHWPTIGSMEDLSAASLEDIKSFFQSYYGPNNASLVIAGDFDSEQAKVWVKKYFGEIPSGPEVVHPNPDMPVLTEEVRFMMEDKVQLPRIYLVWHSVPLYAEDDAVLDVLGEVLSGGKNSRFYRAMIYDNPIAQDAAAFQFSREIAGSFEMEITATPDTDLSAIEKTVWEEVEKIQNELPTEREMRRAINSIEANFVFGIQSIGRKADRLNSYYTWTGIPDGFEKDLSRYSRVTAEDVQRVAKKYLDKNPAK
ncbi:MAG: insulinase family protein [Candidatus Marinimicrobia bacterium]|nr:insulinase family protein [Candidatus Neomarinimicrobiota bacterium]